MNEMLTSGIEVMLIGMGMVYAFLAMLIVAINLMSAFIQRYFPELPAQYPDAPVAQSGDKAVVAAITAVVHQYRKKHRKA